MYEYKVMTLEVKKCEKTFNELAKEGWRVHTISPNIAMGMGVVVTFERKLAE